VATPITLEEFLQDATPGDEVWSLDEGSLYKLRYVREASPEEKAELRQLTGREGSCAIFDVQLDDLELQGQPLSSSTLVLFRTLKEAKEFMTTPRSDS
jgi:hypothetical protein